MEGSQGALKSASTLTLANRISEASAAIDGICKLLYIYYQATWKFWHIEYILIICIFNSLKQDEWLQKLTLIQGNFHLVSWDRAGRNSKVVPWWPISHKFKSKNSFFTYLCIQWPFLIPLHGEEPSHGVASGY